ncbi:LOW QUALITY PROTEIN: sodium/bile acid cotransporter 5 [Trichechus inunguis]
MIRKLCIVLLLLFVTPGEAEKAFLSVLNIEKPENEEETIIVRSSYKEKRPDSSYVFVLSEDPKVLQVLNVTKTSLDVTNFTTHLVTDEEGETNLTIQLWDSEGRQERLIGKIKNIKVKVLKQIKNNPFQASVHFDRNLFTLILPTILLDKCAFGCKIDLHVLQTIWKTPLPGILGAVTQFFLMPFCGFLLTQILALPEAQAFGFVMTCMCPGGGGGNLFALLLEGDVTLAMLTTCTSALLALIMMPVNSSIYSRMSGLSGTFHIPVSKIVSTLIFILITGTVIRLRRPEKANFLERITRPLSFSLMSIGIHLTYRMGLMFLNSLEVLLLGLLVPSLGLVFGGYSFGRICMLPLPVRKTVAIESGILNSFLALAIQLSFSQSKADTASVVPFTVAMCSGCEMLLILLVYKAKKRWILIVEDRRKKFSLV